MLWIFHMHPSWPQWILMCLLSSTLRQKKQLVLQEVFRMQNKDGGGGPLWWTCLQCFSDFPSSRWKFTGRSRIGFVMPVFCCLIQSPWNTYKGASPRLGVMNKQALPLFPWVLFPGCYTECVLLAKPVMDVGLPLSLCLPDKEGISLHWHTHTQR